MSEEELRLRNQIAELEGRLRAQCEATRAASKTADLALSRVQTYLTVVRAARALVAEPNRVNNMFALAEAVEALAPEPTPQ